MRVATSPHPHQHLLLSDFLILVIHVGLKQYFIVALICISLMNNDGVYFFMCVLAIYVSSLEKCLIKSSA